MASTHHRRSPSLVSAPGAAAHKDTARFSCWVVGTDGIRAALRRRRTAKRWTRGSRRRERPIQDELIIGEDAALGIDDEEFGPGRNDALAVRGQHLPKEG